MSALEVIAALKSQRVTPLELIEDIAARIAATNADTNAVVTLCLERARAQAKHYEQEPAPGPLFGLPILVKENQPVEGELFTLGQRAFKARIAAASHPVVEDLQAAGGIVVGLTNMPEHAAGSHTFNDVFGTTSNPHDLSRTAGGSSGGSAAALAVGAAWLATGNDLGGSLRNPAAFCGVVGLRPSPGRCSMSPPPPTAWRGRWGVGLHGVQGPLARSVCDLALLLDALAPLSDAPSPVARHWQESCIPELPPPPRNGFLAHVRQAVAAAGEGPSASDKVGAGLPSQIAWSANLGGLLKGVHPEIAAAVQSSALLLAASCGEGWAAVKNAAPAGLSGAHEAFKPLRFSRNLDDVAGGPGKVSDEYIAAHGNTTKPEILWEFEQGKADGWQRRVAEAEHSRQEIEANFCRFLEVFDILVCPCTLMPPFDKSIRYPATYEPAPAAGAPKAHGRLEMPDYISWMLPCTVVSLANLPALSLPVGFTKPSNGTKPLPIAVQLVARPGRDAELLAAAAVLERAIAQSELAGASRLTPEGDVAVLPIDPGSALPEATSGDGAPKAPRTNPAFAWSGPRTEAEAHAHLTRKQTRTQSTQ